MDDRRDLQTQSRSGSMANPEYAKLDVDLGEQHHRFIAVQDLVQLREDLLLFVLMKLFQAFDQHHKIRGQLTVFGACWDSLPQRLGGLDGHGFDQ